MQLIYTGFVADVDGPMRRESLGLSEYIYLFIHLLHHFLAEVRFALSHVVCLKSNGSIFPGVLVDLHFVQTPHSVPKLKKSKR